MDSVRITGLPAELQVMLFAAMDRGARIADWVSVLNISQEMRAAGETAFGDWVAAQPAGVSFAEFGNSWVEVLFVRDHIDSEDVDRV
jgi:hypothetical protein